MNKEKYIIELRKRLSLLDSKEVDDIISEYLDYIKQKELDGKTEGLALEQLGNVNDLAKSILKGYKISDRYINLFIGKEKIIDEINDFAEKFADLSSKTYSKVEERLSEFARTTGHIAKNVFQETIKFGEERLNEIKKRINKNNEDEDDIIMNKDDETNTGRRIPID